MRFFPPKTVVKFDDALGLTTAHQMAPCKENRVQHLGVLGLQSIDKVTTEALHRGTSAGYARWGRRMGEKVRSMLRDSRVRQPKSPGPSPRHSKLC